MVVMKLVWNESSEKRSSRQLFPTPIAPGRVALAAVRTSCRRGSEKPSNRRRDRRGVRFPGGRRGEAGPRPARKTPPRRPGPPGGSARAPRGPICSPESPIKSSLINVSYVPLLFAGAAIPALSVRGGGRRGQGCARGRRGARTPVAACSLPRTVSWSCAACRWPLLGAAFRVGLWQHWLGWLHSSRHQRV
eukprot:SAG22_NODE_78_length_22065_cov_7.473095_8_plen_191_part_00